MINRHTSTRRRFEITYEITLRTIFCSFLKKMISWYKMINSKFKCKHILFTRKVFRFYTLLFLTKIIVKSIVLENNYWYLYLLFLTFKLLMCLETDKKKFNKTVGNSKLGNRYSYIYYSFVVIL